MQGPKNELFGNCKLFVVEKTANKWQGVVGYLVGEIIWKHILNLKTMLWNLKFTLGVVESMNIFKLSSDMLTFYLCFRKVTETAV